MSSDLQGQTWIDGQIESQLTDCHFLHELISYNNSNVRINQELVGEKNRIHVRAKGFHTDFRSMISHIEEKRSLLNETPKVSLQVLNLKSK